MCELRGALAYEQKGKWYIAEKTVMLVLNAVWSLLNTKGNLANSLPYLNVLTALIFAVVVSVFIEKASEHKAGILKLKILWLSIISWGGIK